MKSLRGVPLRGRPLRAAASPGLGDDGATARAPHVRSALDLGGLARRVALALSPCLLFGTYNVGFQANRALAASSGEAGGWRGDLIAASVGSYDASSLTACFVHGALYVLPLLAAALLAGAACEHAFAVARRRTTVPGLFPSALVFTLALPPTVAPWQAALAFGFGIALGREVFGGPGMTFLGPAVVGLVFLDFAYPAAVRGAVWVAGGGGAASLLDVAASGGAQALAAHGTTWSEAFLGRTPGWIGGTSAAACLVGAAILLLLRAASARTMLAVLLGAVATALAAPWIGNEALPLAGLTWSWHLVLGGFAFGAVFLATDPASSAATGAGRWVHGLLVGFLVVSIRIANPTHAGSVPHAVFLGSVAAPLIDHFVVRANVARRRRRLA